MRPDGWRQAASLPYEWQRRFNASNVTVENRMDKPVDGAIVDELYTKFVDFRRAYDEDGLTVAEFDSFGSTVRTLRQFAKATDDLVTLIRDIMLRNPDV